MLLLLEVLGITLSAFLGFGSIAWFFDQNFFDRGKAFCFRRCALKTLVLLFGLAALALSVHLSVA
ncbi:MAG: hypothetical protein RLZZ221_224 [Verrucomicrobiota bacterium]|jgi:hypothetical protein